MNEMADEDMDAKSCLSSWPEKEPDKETESREMDKNFDGLLTQHLSSFGLYQFGLFAALAILAAGVNQHSLLQVFTGAVLPHRCFSAQFSADSDTNSSDPNATTLGDADMDRTCYIYAVVNESKDAIGTTWNAVSNTPQRFVTEECKQWDYDRTQYLSSIVSEWNLVCKEHWLSSFAMSLYMAGSIIGSVVFGDLSDRFGRRKILLIVTVMELVVGVATAFVPNLQLYVICRLLVGIAVAAQWNCAYIIAVELVAPRWRSAASVLMLYSAASGIMLMAGTAYFIRDWRKLQLAISAPLGILLVFFVMAPESPRWLLLRRRTRQAGQLVRTIARINRTRLPTDYESYLNIPMTTQDSGHGKSMLDLFRTTKLRFRTLSLGFLWFTCCATYYCLSLNTSNLGGNDYINFFLCGAAEIPADTFALWALQRFGRRPIIASTMILGGLVLLTTTMIPTELVIARIVLAMGGKMCISVAYVILYPFSVEQFPTVLRNNGMGIVSGAGGRIGGFVAPYIVLLNMYSRALPFLVCGFMVSVGGIISMLLPETNQCSLPDTIEDVERIPNPSPCSFVKNMWKKRHRNTNSKVVVLANDSLDNINIYNKRMPEIDKMLNDDQLCDPATESLKSSG